MKFDIAKLFFDFKLLDFPLIRVRRRMYKPNTTAGKGIKWEWLSLTTSEWNLYNMDVQNIIEDAWSKVGKLICLNYDDNCEIIEKCSMISFIGCSNV